MMLQKVKKLSIEYDMLPRDTRILCAVSGGVDSMCLLHLLKELAEGGGFQVVAAHYNHRLRGAESEEDAAFVADWCARQGIECVTGAGDVAAEAARLRQGIEETARQMRYTFLQETAERRGCSRIATAHNADDNAETLLLHLVRGAGLHGLTGIPPRRDNIVRPLLTCSRAEIEACLNAQRIPHREDSSNPDEVYSRNKLRAKVMPVLRELNPRFTENTADTIRYLRSDNDYLNAQAARVCTNARWAEDDLVIEAAIIAQLPAAIASRAARQLLTLLGDGSADCAASHLNAIVDLARSRDPSAYICLPGGLLVQRVYGDLLFTTRMQTVSMTAVPLNETGVTVPPDSLWSVECTPCVCPPGESTPEQFCLSKAKCGQLFLRPRETGDALRLPRREGSRTVKKILIDAKIPRRDRERIPVLADESGVVALAGFGPAADRLATPGEAAYKLTFIRTEEV